MNTYLFLMVLVFSVSAFAAKGKSNLPLSQCLFKAQLIAQVLDQTNDDGFAQTKVSAEIKKFHNVAADSEQTQGIYRFNFEGESYLEVVIDIDSHQAGDCEFRSATKFSQD